MNHILPLAGYTYDMLDSEMNKGLTGMTSGISVTSGISWVTPENFDPDMVTLQEGVVKQGDTYERSKLMYQYTPDGPKKDLIVTVPKNPDAYLVCRGVHKDIFSRGDSRIETNRYVSHLVLSGNNEHHLAMYKMFEQLIARVQQLTGKNVTFPAKDMDGYAVLYTGLIHATEGRMYSTAYTDKEEIDITECKKCLVRPALLLSTIKKSSTEVKIRVQLSQMYVYKAITDFPLATQE